MTQDLRHYSDPKTVKPYRRGENGRYIPHPCFEGDAPTEPKNHSGWLLVMAAVAFLLAMKVAAS